MRTNKTTKLLALTLSLLMLFTMIPLSVSADETTGTILDVAQNDGNDNYYLTGDVKVTATYADEFTGTFDGRGFTVTTSVPLFKSVNNATIENLTVAEGTITGMSSIANYISGNATFKQITNNATINGSTLSLIADYDSAITSTDSVTGGIAGLIIGSSDDGTVVNFENCVNNGEVTTIETTGNASTGGILGAAMFLNNLSNTGYANKVEINFVNCTNVGKIEAKNNAGGILGVTYGGVASLSVTECQNNGNVIAGSHAGGITGMTDPTVEPAYFTNCGSNGTITSNDIAGGIVGRAKAKIKIEYCTNELNAEETNTVTAKAHGGGILGYADKSYETTIENCTNEVPVSYNKNDKKTHIGGIVGYGNSPLALLNCYNSGNVTSSDIAGGIVGRVAEKTAITYCGNTADVVATSSTSGWAYYGGGILGYEGGKEVDISYCYNTGNIKFNLYGGGIAGRIHNTLSDIIGCYNSGTVELWNTSVNNPKLGQIAHIGNHGTLANNYYDATKILTPYNDTAVKATPYNTDGTTDDLTSGALALAMNKSIGKTVYYQNVNAGTTTDAHPVLDSTHGHVFNTGNSQYSSLRFHTLETASVRLNEDGVSGLRFSTAVNKEDYTALEATGITLDFGTIITPDEYLQAADNSFTALESEKYIDVNSTAVGKDNFITLKGESDDYYYFCGSITGIKEDNYDWDYSAIGYVTIGADTVYSSQYATRSIAYVASAAYNDRSATFSEFYNNDVSETEYAIEGKPYSPYTKEQLATIKEYL